MKYVVLLVVFAWAGTAFSQSKSFTALGVALLAEGDDYSAVPAFGLSLEHKATQHSGFETGVYYRNFKQEYYYINHNMGSYNSVSFDSMLTYLSVPLLYKFYSNIVNFELGVTADLYLSGERLVYTYQRDVGDPVKKTFSPKARAGGLLKISKSINLGERLVLEPEIRVNRLLEPIHDSSPRALFVGFGIGIKYKMGIKEEKRSE